MNISTAKNDLALRDLDGTRKYLDEINYNIRDIFHGNDQETGTLHYGAVDIAEHLINALDIFTYALEELTQLDASQEDLPKINSIITSLRYIVDETKATGERLKSGISNEYFGMVMEKTENLSEAIDDTERIFFELRNDKDFMAVANRLLGL
ncbi:hypothetical protein [Dyadobacter fanqingshengii]|uniref:Uncharacterized protein n=1 Tax=Dyadobacter fanqingshengii TaxID=2906443 RepID=A0A9X1P9I8_9BACT|nr:hypothetical protein [Dyadobacter fanqingshengii]MCF0041221.1 hypothetical protein [Dyadobacter fanqingshengii]USJ37054.2 hypothetical protein NFI81_04595 [Dyadobacter fanqingshengii]